LLALLLPGAAAAASLSVHPDGGLRMQGPPGGANLAAACEGTPAEPTWRVGADGFHAGEGADAVLVHPRLARAIQSGSPTVGWSMAWDAADLGLSAPANAAVEATLLADAGAGFEPLATGTSSPRLLLNGESTFRFPLSADAVLLPAGAVLALEVVLHGTEACADGDAGVVLTGGNVDIPAGWDFRVEVQPQQTDGQTVFWASVTSDWGGYDEEELMAELELEGPSKLESRAVEGPFGHLQNAAMRDRGERLFSWTWNPGKQGAAPGTYEAFVSAYPTRGIAEFPFGTGDAKVEVHAPAAAPSPAVLVLVLALGLAAMGRRRFDAPVP
jgi:hypothetical protein